MDGRRITKVEEQFGQQGARRVHLLEEDGVVRRQQKDTVVAAESILSWLQNLVRFVLLPQGYPASVSDDYLEYQLWDTLQAFCSYLSGTLTTKAVMQGMGVGDAAATPLAATITWIMRDGTGMIGRIAFASWKGPELDTNCKKWRLAADILNDMAMSLEICSPLFPEAYFSLVLCLATSMKAIVGVAGGATRAALTQHQARHGNMADVAAKDGSQETFVNLVASNIGIFLLPLITDDKHAWMLFFVMTCVHIFANYKAVCCLNIPILNDQRYNILYLAREENSILSPKKVNSQESVLLGQNRFSSINGWQIQLGAPLSALPGVSALQINHAALLNSDFLVLVSPQKKSVAVIFKKGSTMDPLKAYFHALSVAQNLDAQMPTEEQITKGLSAGSKIAKEDFPAFKKEAMSSGWLMDRHQLLVDQWVSDWEFSDTGDKKED